MEHYAIKSNVYKELINSVYFYEKYKFILYKYKDKYYLNTYQYICMEDNSVDTKYIAHLFKRTFLKVDEFNVNKLASSIVSNLDNIYVDKNETLVKEFCDRTLVFDNIYVYKCIDSMENLYNYINLLLDYQKDAFKYSRLTVAQLYDLFKLEAIWFLLMFYDEELRKKYYICKDVDRLPLYSIPLIYKDIFDFIIKESMRYTVYGIESKYKFGIKNKTIYDKTLIKLQNLLSNYKFFDYKLNSVKSPIDDVYNLYMKGLFFKKSGDIINFADSYFLYDKLKGFNDTKQNYSKFINDNEIIVIADEDVDKYNNYYIVQKEDEYIWNTILPMIRLLEIKAKLGDTIDNLSQEEYLYMYLYLLLLTPIDDDLDIKFRGFEFNMLTETHLLDDLFK